MAFSVIPNRALFVFAVFISITLFCCKFGYAEDDPAQVVAKALLCFSDKFIYESCDEAYRLNESGNINVPREATDEYCSGSCLAETNLVLDCIDNVLSNYLFNNEATIKDVRDTVYAGCSYTSERGNFNVAAHIQGESSYAHKVAYSLYLGVYTLMVVGCSFFL